MFKKEALERFIIKANAWQYDYGDGLKNLPLLSRDPADPVGTYTANVPLLSVPLVGDLEHRGDKFKYHGVTTAAAVQDTDWDSVPKDARSDVREGYRKAGLGQGAKFDNTPTTWGINFGAENARMGISTWGGAGGVAKCKVLFRDDGTGNNQMIFCDDASALYSHVRRDGTTGMLQWDTVRWASAKVNGVDAPTDTTPLDFNVVYDLEMTANGNTGVRWVGEGPSSANNTFMTGFVNELSFTGGNSNRAYDMTQKSDTQPTNTVIVDTVGSNNATLVGFGSRPLWAPAPF